METRLGFSPEVSLWSELSSADLSVVLDASVLGLEVSAPLPETQTSIKREAIPAVEEEATMGWPTDPLPAPTMGTKGPRSLGPRRLGMPRSR